jgi:DnaK suppressor protein
MREKKKNKIDKKSARARQENAPSTPIKVKGKFPKAKNDLQAALMDNLLVKKRELERILERLIGTQKEYGGQLRAGDFIDEFDDAQREISSQKQYILIERKVKELKKVEYLLNRVGKDGQFGSCEECGKTIPRERLLIVPDATLCVACQHELERENSRLDQRIAMTPPLGERDVIGWHKVDEIDDGSKLKISSSRNHFSISDDLHELDPEDSLLDNDN